MARTTNQSRRSKKSRQARATLKPPAPVSRANPVAVDRTGVESLKGESRVKTRPAASNARAGEAVTSRHGQVSSLSREREYEFIREDIKRLVYTAGILIVVMVALLFLADQ